MTRYDRKAQERYEAALAKGKRAYYNHYALARYLEGCDLVIKDMKKGMSLEDAIKKNFLDRLQAFVLKFMADPKHDPKPVKETKKVIKENWEEACPPRWVGEGMRSHRQIV